MKVYEFYTSNPRGSVVLRGLKQIRRVAQYIFYDITMLFIPLTPSLLLYLLTLLLIGLFAL